MIRLPQSPLVSIPEELSRQSKELATKQLVGGDCLLGYITASMGAYDINTGAIPVNGVVQYLITFTPTTPNQQALVQMYSLYSVDTPDVANNFVTDQSFSLVQPVNVQPIPVSGATSTWYVSFYNSDFAGPHTAYMKLYFSGTDTGTFSIAAA